jgi:hypothetical protein
MHTEPLHVVWEYHGGVRAGFANYKGTPHYFEQLWEELDYGSTFILKPVSPEIVEVARKAREIFCSWEDRRAMGKEDMASRPDIPGKHPLYWKLYSKVIETLRATSPLREPASARILLSGNTSSIPQNSLHTCWVEWDSAA